MSYRYYPLKPKTKDGFRKAVAWFGGRELIASLKGTIIYSVYGENNDPRSWMKPNVFPETDNRLEQQNVVVEEKADKKEAAEEIGEKVNKFWKSNDKEQWDWKRTRFKKWDKYLDWKKDQPVIEEEFWFDYISDTGDGQMGVYSVACLCFADLWLDGFEKEDKNNKDKDATSELLENEVKFTPPENTKDFENHTLLPRGSFLFVGGDTAYHSANYATLFERFQSPFRWGFASVRKFMLENYDPDFDKIENQYVQNKDGEVNKVEIVKDIDKAKSIEKPLGIDEFWDGTFAEYDEEGVRKWDTEPMRPLFGIPANHDYYDAIDGFNKQFRRPPFADIQENRADKNYKGHIFLKIHSFARQQEASYMAIQIPFEWWMFGIDSENKTLDPRQKVFFKEIVENIGKENKPKKLILATPEPTTVFGRECPKDDKTAKYLAAITNPNQEEVTVDDQPFLQQGKLAENTSCRLDLSGDVHHYARYWGSNRQKFRDEKFTSNNYASLVSGGGGAFFDATETLIGKPIDYELNDDEKNKIRGEIPPQEIYPCIDDSVNASANGIFDLWNIKKGGYVHIAGAIIAVIIFFSFTVKGASNISSWFDTFDKSFIANGLSIFGDNFSIQSMIERFFNSKGSYFGVILFGINLLLFATGFSIDKTVDSIKYKLSTNELDEDKDGTIYQIIWNAIPLGLAFFLYVFLFLPFIEDDYEPFTNSWFLLYHLIIAGLLVWISIAYSKWLPLRLQIVRGYKEKSFLQILKDPNIEPKNWLQKFIGTISRELSFERYPEIILVALSILSLIAGFGLFGRSELLKTVVDIVFTILLIFLFAAIAGGLGYSMGGKYKKSYGKKIVFLGLGTWHAILQIFTPFVLIYFGDWKFTLIVFVIITLINGFSKSANRLEYFLSDERKKKGIGSYIWRLANFRFAAAIMKLQNRSILTLSWFIYGLFVLITPIYLSMFFSKNVVSANTLITLIMEDQKQNIRVFLDISKNAFIQGTLIPQFVKYLPLLAVLAVVAFVGYRLSRVWLSWYLAVSLANNGHNNEAGGLARVEDYKHILRIRVRKDDLTVFVIGIDKAKPDLEELIEPNGKGKPNVKLVDKFTLNCKSIIN